MAGIRSDVEEQAEVILLPYGHDVTDSLYAYAYYVGQSSSETYTRSVRISLSL